MSHLVIISFEQLFSYS